MPSSHLEAKSVDSKFVQSRFLLKYVTWSIMCVITWHDCTWHGWGYLPWPPTPNWVVHVHASFALRGTDVERPHIEEYEIHTVRERWSQPVCWLHLVGGGHGHPPLPFNWVMHAHYHFPTQESKFNQNFKIKFQTYFEIILNGNILRLMFV
jgi:hypothetical protein